MQVTLPVRPTIAAPVEVVGTAPAAAPVSAPVNAAPPAATQAPPAAAAIRDSEGGLFFKAVFRSFARLSEGSGGDDGARVVAQQKVKIELEIEDDGDFSLEIDVKSKVRVRGADGDDALRIAGDFMQAMQAFTAELFSTLKGLFAPQPAAQTGTTPPAVQAPTPAAAPLPAPVTQPPTEVVDAAPVVTAPAAAAAATDTAATPPVASTLPRFRLQAAYVSMEMRVSLLADLVQRAERGDELAGLGTRFDRLAAALRPQGAPTLSDFLRTLARPAATDAPAALPLRASGGFVSTTA